MEYTIIQDTREQQPWEFSKADVEIKTLNTGDYTLKGYENELCIERKASAAELANNLGKQRKRFERELERMAPYPHTFLILEFSMDDLLMYPHGSNIPKSMIHKIRIGGGYMLKTITQYMLDYDIKVIFAGNKENAVRTAKTIFKMVAAE